MKKIVTIAAVILGIIFLIVAAVYFLEPAKSLPTFFPGYDTTLSKHHYKHAIGVLLLGFALFAYAWFQTGKKSTKEKQKTE